MRVKHNYILLLLCSRTLRRGVRICDVFVSVSRTLTVHEDDLICLDAYVCVYVCAFVRSWCSGSREKDCVTLTSRQQDTADTAY